MLFQEEAISTLQTNERENERTLKVEMDMFTFVTMLNPTVVGIFVMMCATAYAFILDVEAKLDAKKQAQAQAQQQDADNLEELKKDADDLAELKKVVAQEKKKQHKIQEVVYQLLGGMFNQETQSKVLKHHVNLLMGNEMVGSCSLDENIMPTTRQGDENTREIANLSQVVSDLQIKEKENVKTIQKQQEQIDRMEGSLKRIIEGLYDWETQAPVFTHEIDLLMGFPFTRKNGFVGMENECDINPTTQQGFRLEKRIAALESRVRE